MKRLLSILLLVLSAPAWSDEAADRAGIAQVILALNKSPQAAELFEESADTSVLDELWSGKRIRVRLLAPPASPDSMTVIVSHEPWGEARIGQPLPAMEAVNPRISAGKVQFVSPDVALADGEFIYSDQTGSQSVPLLFVMKRDVAAWKIAVVRRPAPGPLSPTR